jgi:iron complex outermembrane receptor protein
VVPDQLQTFQGEELISYEVGFKSQWLDNRVRANLTAFYSDYSKRLSQATGKECLGAPGASQPYLPAATCPAGTFAEPPWFYYVTGPASVQGLEGEFAYEPIAHLRWDASFGYNHYKSKVTDPTAPNYIDPANLPQPEWNANSGVQYGIAVPGGVFTPRLEWTFQSKMTFNGTPALPYDARFGVTGQAAYDLTATPARSLFNARLGYDSDDGKWGAAFTVTNLFNKFYWEDKFDLSGLVVSGVPSRPRTWLLSVSRNFR